MIEVSDPQEANMMEVAPKREIMLGDLKGRGK